jgi:Legionella pneumophila major outer membrane protein precursor
MARKISSLLAFTVFASCVPASLSQDLPPGPTPIVPSSPPSQMPPAAAPNGAPAALPPATDSPHGPAPLLPPTYAPYQDRNGPLLRGDPLIDRPFYPQPGWFATVELDVLAPHIKNRLIAPVTLDGFEPNTVHLPTAELDWVGSPRFEFGYRCAEGLGEILFSFRFLDSEGNDTISNFDLDGSDGFLKSRLSLDVLDIDYGSREYSLAPCWDMKWKVGIRLADVFFDSRADGYFLEQRTRNLFYGAGPHVGVDLWRSFSVPGLGLFCRVEAASLFGQVRQRFEESVLFDDGTLLGAETSVRHTQAVPVLDTQFGVSWTPAWHRHWSRFSTGYQFEQWWDLGQAGDSRAELTLQGIFFRAEFNF